MARGGVTYSEVARAAQQLRDAGTAPTVDTVRAQLGHTGSKSTIGPLLKQWKEKQEADSLETASGLPASLLQTVRDLRQTIVAEADMVIAKARDEFRSQATQMESQAQELRNQLKALHGQLAAMTADRDAQVALLEQERAGAAVLRTANAELKESLHAQEVRLAETVAEREARDRELATARQQAAHFEAAVAQQRYEDHDAMNKQLAQRDETARALRLELQDIRGQWLTAERHGAALAEQVTLLRDSLQAARQAQEQLVDTHAKAAAAWHEERATLQEHDRRGATDMGRLQQQLEDTVGRLENLVSAHAALKGEHQVVLLEKARLQERLALADSGPPKADTAS